MPLSRAQIRDNPWWAKPSAIEQDPYLRRLGQQALRFEHPIPFDLDTDAVYTLRGPRQVGKSTLLKRIIRDLLRLRNVSPRDVMYFDVLGGGIPTAHALQEAIEDYIGFARSGRDADRLYILLDEVTGVTNWGSAIQVLHGRGDLDGVTLIATGSHARDLRRGGERAPGRHGKVDHWDWVMMPLSFRDYVGLHDPETAEALPTLDLFDPEAAFAAAREIALHGPAIEPLFERYLRTGGYPHATSAEAGDDFVPARVYRIYQEALMGEIRRAGHREDYFRELVAWIADHRLGKEFSWSDASGGTMIGSGNTVREYLEDAQAAFAWHIVHRVQTIASPAEAPRSPKKLYPADPFTWHVLASWVTGRDDPWAETMERTADPSRKGDLIESYEKRVIAYS